MRGLTEVTPVQDIYVSGLGGIERVGGNNLRLHLYVEQENEDGTKEKVLVAKIIAPASAIPDAVLQMIATIAGKTASPVPMIDEMVH